MAEGERWSEEGLLESFKGALDKLYVDLQLKPEFGEYRFNTLLVEISSVIERVKSVESSELVNGKLGFEINTINNNDVDGNILVGEFEGTAYSAVFSHLVREDSRGLGTCVIRLENPPVAEGMEEESEDSFQPWLDWFEEPDSDFLVGPVGETGEDYEENLQPWGEFLKGVDLDLRAAPLDETEIKNYDLRKISNLIRHLQEEDAATRNKELPYSTLQDISIEGNDLPFLVISRYRGDIKDIVGEKWYILPEATSITFLRVSEVGGNEGGMPVLI